MKLNLDELVAPGSTQGQRTTSRLHMLATFLGIPLVLLTLCTCLFGLTDIDLAISGLFYGGNQTWPLADTAWVGMVCNSVVALGSALAIATGFALIGSLLLKPLRPLLPAALFLGAVAALGPWWLVNEVFKVYWGRPRPDAIAPFDGPALYLRVWDYQPQDDGHSFPSGHAAMGFYLMAPAFVLYRHSRRESLAWLLAGLSCGTIVGVARVAQGRHFASDILWSAAFVYFAALAACPILHLGEALPRWTSMLVRRRGAVTLPIPHCDAWMADRRVNESTVSRRDAA